MSTPVKRKRYITKDFPAMWPWLITPDRKFCALGEYSCDLVMPPADCKSLCTEVVPDVQEQAKKIRMEQEYKDWILAWPVKDEKDESEHVTGNKLVKFDQKIRDGYDFRVTVLDSKNKPVSPTLKLGNGTIIKVCFTVRVVADNLNSCLRIKFHPLAAQIIKLVEYSQDFGFKEEANAYTAPATSADDASPLDEYQGEIGDVPKQGVKKAAADGVGAHVPIVGDDLPY